MSERKFAIVTTRLPPATCGIGAYSARLREHWPGAGRNVEFLVIDGAGGAEKRASDRVTEFAGNGPQLAQSLGRLGNADVLLHYAGRAYQRFGCPRWMPRVFRDWKRKFSGARLMIIVHEMPAEGFPITSRHFWFGKIGSGILRELAQVADILVTNTEKHAMQLCRISGRNDVQLLPVGSNIEVAESAHAESRAPTEFALFGLSFGRWQALLSFDAQVLRWHASGRLTKLHIVGPGGDEFTEHAEELMAAWPASLHVKRHGSLPASEVSQLLGRSRFALTNVTPNSWSKSGAFMACAAHQCAVVIAGAGSSAAPLSFAVRADEVETLSAAEINARTAALAAWYREHADWPVLAARLAVLWEEKEARVG